MGWYALIPLGLVVILLLLAISAGDPGDMEGY